MKILDLEIKSYGYKEILDVLEANIISRNYFSFSYVNTFVALTARQNLSFKDYIAEFSALFPDGIGIYLASRFLYGKAGLLERISGTDLYYNILDLAERKGYNIFFFGGSDKAANSLESQIRKMYPNLFITNIIPRNLIFDEKILSEINSSKSDILLLGLGTPYQEKWVATFGQKCNIPVQIAVGSGIDFLSGTYKRAPKVMRNIGLEWLYRLFLEPKRLWKRYLLGIPHFIFLIVKQKYSGELHRD